MTHAESRTITYAIVGSLAVHVLLAVAFGAWIGVVSLHQMLTTPRPEVEPQAEVTLVFPDPPNLNVETLPPPPKPKTEPYIRTTQNTAVAEAPKDANFESDRNTVAMTQSSTATPGAPPMPSMNGIDRVTKELADRAFKDGETKNDSAATPPPAKPQPKPEPKPEIKPPALPAPKPEPPKVAEKPPVPKPAPLPEPPPPPAPKPTPPPVVEKPQPKEEEAVPAPVPPPTPQMAKKDDSAAEVMMKELDEKLKVEAPKPEPPKPTPEPPKTLPPPAPEKPPIMREAIEEDPIPKAIPVAGLVKNTPKPEENAFQPETHRGKIEGSISNVGDEDAVAAAATPAGRYKRIVTSAIEKKWHYFYNLRRDAVLPGHMSLQFYVNEHGKIEDLKILEDMASPLVADFTIEAILKAEIPPLPADFVPKLNKGRLEKRLEMIYNIVITPK